MAFGLTKIQAYAIEIDQPVTKKFKQYCVLDITGAAADVDVDLGDDSGTFWTAVGSAEALALLKACVTQAGGVSPHTVKSEALNDRIQIAAVSGAGEYSLAYQNNRPNIAFNAGDGETSWKLVLEWDLPDNAHPIKDTVEP